MGTLRRFPKSHLIAICLIAMPMASLTLVGEDDDRVENNHDEMNLVSVPPIVEDTIDRLVLDLQSPTSPVVSDTGSGNSLAATDPNVSERVEKVRAGDSLARVFERVAVSQRDLAAVLESGPLAKVLQHIYPGHEIRFVTSPETGLVKLSYAPGRLETLEFERDGNEFKAKHVTRDAQISSAYKHATIDQSLFVASQQAGLSDEMTLRLAQIFQWDIDFVLDIRKGDGFSVLFEEKYVDGDFIGFGKILAAEFINQNTRYRAVYYVDSSGRGDYFSASGESMRKAFIRAPVEFSRISSNFNPRRYHPVQKRVMPHRGIDYVAPVRNSNTCRRRRSRHQSDANRAQRKLRDPSARRRHSDQIPAPVEIRSRNPQRHPSAPRSGDRIRRSNRLGDCSAPSLRISGRWCT